jgi:hypothetical protein
MDLALQASRLLCDSGVYKGGGMRNPAAMLASR